MKIKERNEVVEKNYRLIWFVIDKYFPNKNNREDMYQEGVIGLIQAVENYNDDIAMFSTYAVPKIRGAIQRFVEMDNPVYTPQWAVDALTRYNKTKDKILIETGREPTHEQICKVIKVKPERMSEAITARTLFTIDVNEDEAPIDIIDENATELHDSEKEHLIENVLRRLDERSREYIIKHFYENISYRNIGKMYGVSGARVQQVVKRAMKKLKIYIGG